MGDRLRGRATSLAFGAAWQTLRWVPEPPAHRAFGAIADRIVVRNGGSVRQLRANLSMVRPDLSDDDLERLTREGVRSYLRYWRETFARTPTADVVRRTRVVDEHIVHELYGQGRGLVAALPHMANWDWAGVWATQAGMPLVTVAERLEPARLYDRFVAYRSALGMEILPLTGGPPAFPRMTEWVSGGGFACLLADRDLSGTGVEVELCGHRALLPRGPALLARRTGAPLMPVTLSYDGPDMVMRLHPPVEPARGTRGAAVMTQRLADVFSHQIREHPQDWHMMQPIFVDA